MNVQRLIAALAVLAATGSVFAGDVDPFPTQEPVVSTKTRAEVQAELAQARAQGLLPRGDIQNFPVLAPARSTRSREEVRSEAIESVKNRKRNPGYDSGR